MKFTSLTVNKIIQKYFNKFNLTERDLEFLKRIYNVSIKRYERRILNIGFKENSKILDAGCGFGQWTLAFLNQKYSVSGIDFSDERINFCEVLQKELLIPNNTFKKSKLEKITFEDSTFDGIFCYSSLYYCNWKKVLKEFFRISKKNARIYIVANGTGWYLKNILEKPNNTDDFDPKKMAFKCIDNTINSLYGKKSFEGDEIIPSWVLEKKLNDIGFKVLYKGEEGSFNLFKKQHDKLNFFQGFFDGYECVYEIIAIKT